MSFGLGGEVDPHMDYVLNIDKDFMVNMSRQMFTQYRTAIFCFILYLLLHVSLSGAPPGPPPRPPGAGTANRRWAHFV